MMWKIRIFQVLSNRLNKLMNRNAVWMNLLAKCQSVVPFLIMSTYVYTHTHTYICLTYKMILFFLNLDSLHARLNNHYKTWSQKNKKRNKIKAYRKSVKKEPTVKRCLLILDLKATQIIGQKKTFYRRRIPEFSCARTETIDINILVTPRNSHREIMQSIKIRNRPPSRIRKWNQFSQFR